MVVSLICTNDWRTSCQTERTNEEACGWPDHTNSFSNDSEETSRGRWFHHSPLLYLHPCSVCSLRWGSPKHSLGATSSHHKILSSTLFTWGAQPGPYGGDSSSSSPGPPNLAGGTGHGKGLPHSSAAEGVEAWPWAQEQSTRPHSSASVRARGPLPFPLVAGGPVPLQLREKSSWAAVTRGERSEAPARGTREAAGGSARRIRNLEGRQSGSPAGRKWWSKTGVRLLITPG